MEEEFKFNHFMPAQIRFSDVDQFGHMNNSVYFSLYDLAKTTYFKDVLGMNEWGDVVVVVASSSRMASRLRLLPFSWATRASLSCNVPW